MSDNIIRFRWLAAPAMFFLALLGTLAGCSTSEVITSIHPRDGRGQVVERDSGTPIEGAIVIGIWKKVVGGTWLVPVDSRDVCVHVETAVTDAQGRYQIALWDDRPPNYFLDSYKPGYVQAIEYQQDTDRYGRRGIEPLVPFKGTRMGRFDYLMQQVRASGCLGAGESKKNLYPLYEAIYYEAKSLAATEKDQKALQWLREIAAADAVGLGDDHDANEKRIKQFLREHLQ